MRKILIPTDFSENAMNAIRFAMELFKFDRSDFIVMHAFADEVYENTLEMERSFFEEYRDKMQNATERQLQKVVSEMLEISPNPNHKYNYLATFDTMVDACNDIANKENIDVIVMGTRGKTDDREITFGSQTLQVIKYVKCPVLAVPKGFEMDVMKNILFPTDYLIPYKGREVKLVNVLAKNFGAMIHVLHITGKKILAHRQEDNKTFLECSLDEDLCQFHTREGKDIATTINSMVSEESIDLLVMVNSRHSYMESLLVDSTIDTIGLHIKIPFLVLQNLPR
ncbi:MAG: universal stress protein [Bacteroidia bacterium]|nr:universal stress protein [Bacteroidia bacterium]NNM23813.1 universal stress protein [Flavobacteriaceae bacterium]